ncbi:hypothetical protein C8R45DRAFT_1109938 [Mycena sanguinolenta]|nr:hypothetical protein C8R45DRAFT_1109938 [Mycena sanguinolenta]
MKNVYQDGDRIPTALYASNFMDPPAHIQVSTVSSEEILHRQNTTSNETIVACTAITGGEGAEAVDQPSPTLLCIDHILCQSITRAVRVATLATESDGLVTPPPSYSSDNDTTSLRERSTSVIHITPLWRDITPARPQPLQPTPSLITARDIRHNKSRVDIAVELTPWRTYTFMAPFNYSQPVAAEQEFRFLGQLRGNWIAKAVVWARGGKMFVLVKEEERSYRAQRANAFADMRLAHMDAPDGIPPPPPPTPVAPVKYANGPSLDGLQEVEEE